MTLQCHTISYHHIIHTSPIAFATIIPYHTCLPDSATFFQCPQNDERYPPVIWHSFDIAVESHPCVDDLPIIIIGYNWWCSIVQYLCQILRGYFSPNSTAVFFFRFVFGSGRPRLLSFINWCAGVAVPQPIDEVWHRQGQRGWRTAWFLWQSWFISSLTMVCSWLGL